MCSESSYMLPVLTLVYVGDLETLIIIPFLGFIHTTLAHHYKNLYRINIHNINLLILYVFRISSGCKAQANIT